MATYYVGWDVGGWYCDQNASSRDAIVVLGSDGKEVEGCKKRRVVRGELGKKHIHEFLNAFFKTNLFGEKDSFIFAIDAVFSFPGGMSALLSGGPFDLDGDAWKAGGSMDNPLLFRYTERFVRKTTGKKPLSVIQDSIGSQAAKAIYFLRHFGFVQRDVGIWKNGSAAAVETYPSVEGEKGDDVADAETCARLAKKFAQNSELLFRPDDGYDKTSFESRREYRETIKTEGWIWFSKEKAVARQ